MVTEVKDNVLQKELSKEALYMRNYRKNRKEGLNSVKVDELEEIKESLRVEALKEEAPAAVKSAYVSLLKYIREKKEDEGRLSADELARMNIEAEKQLREEGFIS